MIMSAVGDHTAVGQSIVAVTSILPLLVLIEPVLCYDMTAEHY